MAATVIGKLPAGVEAEVLSVNRVEQFGLQLPEENEAVAPEGRPEAEKETDWVEPDIKVVLTEFVTEEAVLTDWFPEFATEKSKVGVVGETTKDEPICNDCSANAPLPG